MNAYMEQTEQYVLHTYNRFPVVLESGNGVYLKDTTEKNIWILQRESRCMPLVIIIRDMMKL